MTKNIKILSTKITLAIITLIAFSVVGINIISVNNKYSIGTTSASSQEPADINSDLRVDIVDLSILLSKWGTSGNLSDLNIDGYVDIVDLSILLSKWGTVISEPSLLPEWTGDYETGDLSQFKTGSWEFYPNPASAQVVAASTVSPSGSGNYIGKYYVPSGASSSSTTVRAENYIDSNYNFTNGQDKWFSFSVYLGSDMPASTSNWQVVAQWKNNLYGSPPASISINDGKFRFDGGYGYPGSATNENYILENRQYSQDIANATRNVWHKFTVHIYFHDDPSKGYVELWHNGQAVSWNPYVTSPYPKVISGSKFYPPGGTLYPGAYSYLKMGLYRSANIQQASTLYHDNWKIGSSRESVDY